jgi:hypothetical protein
MHISIEKGVQEFVWALHQEQGLFREQEESAKQFGTYRASHYLSMPSFESVHDKSMNGQKIMPNN